MCDMCWQTPCASRCPNHDSTKDGKRCDNCGQPIYIGEIAVELLDYVFCMECVENAERMVEA